MIRVLKRTVVRYGRGYRKTSSLHGGVKMAKKKAKTKAKKKTAAKKATKKKTAKKKKAVKKKK